MERRLREAVRIDPRSAEALSNLGMVLGRQGRLDAAIERFLKAISINPSYVDAYNNLGFAYAQQGRVDDAARAYRSVLRLEPGNPKALRGLDAVLNAKKSSTGG